MWSESAESDVAADWAGMTALRATSSLQPALLLNGVVRRRSKVGAA